jgi:hypothetical protein
VIVQSYRESDKESEQKAVDENMISKIYGMEAVLQMGIPAPARSA